MLISRIINHKLKAKLTSVRLSDQTSIQARVRPTDSPSSLTETQNKYCVECYNIYSIHSHYKTTTLFVVATNVRHLCSGYE